MSRPVRKITNGARRTHYRTEIRIDQARRTSEPLVRVVSAEMMTNWHCWWLAEGELAKGWRP